MEICNSEGSTGRTDGNMPQRGEYRKNRWKYARYCNMPERRARSGSCTIISQKTTQEERDWDSHMKKPPATRTSWFLTNKIHGLRRSYLFSVIFPLLTEPFL
jgi:hypothetical protein